MNIIKRLLPSHLKSSISSMCAVKFIRLLRCYIYDMRRFIRFSGLINPLGRQATLKARILKECHCVEKAFSLKKTRVGFGAAIVRQLVDDLNIYCQKYGAERLTLIALNVLLGYDDFNRSNGVDDSVLREKLSDLKTMMHVAEECSEGGVLKLSKEEINSSIDFDFEKFSATRYSIRHFGGGDVDDEVIADAVRIALKTPSVCNRQGWKVHLYNTREAKERVLVEQSGNRGFGEFCNKVLIVTCDLSAFLAVGERNQGFVDAGLFAMSLLYALHSKGLGACTLNWSVDSSTDKRMKKASRISDEETPVLMIAIGNLAEEFEVACSSRKKLSEVLCVHSEVLNR